MRKKLRGVHLGANRGRQSTRRLGALKRSFGGLWPLLALLVISACSQGPEQLDVTRARTDFKAPVPQAPDQRDSWLTSSGDGLKRRELIEANARKPIRYHQSRPAELGAAGINFTTSLSEARGRLSAPSMSWQDGSELVQRFEEGLVIYWNQEGEQRPNYMVLLKGYLGTLQVGGEIELKLVETSLEPWFEQGDPLGKKGLKRFFNQLTERDPAFDCFAEDWCEVIDYSVDELEWRLPSMTLVISKKSKVVVQMHLFYRESAPELQKSLDLIRQQLGDAGAPPVLFLGQAHREVMEHIQQDTTKIVAGPNYYRKDYQGLDLGFTKENHTREALPQAEDRLKSFLLHPSFGPPVLLRGQKVLVQAGKGPVKLSLWGPELPADTAHSYHIFDPSSGELTHKVEHLMAQKRLEVVELAGGEKRRYHYGKSPSSEGLLVDRFLSLEQLEVFDESNTLLARYRKVLDMGALEERVQVQRALPGGPFKTDQDLGQQASTPLWKLFIPPGVPQQVKRRFVLKTGEHLPQQELDFLRQWNQLLCQELKKKDPQLQLWPEIIGDLSLDPREILRAQVLALNPQRREVDLYLLDMQRGSGLIYSVGLQRESNPFDWYNMQALTLPLQLTPFENRRQFDSPLAHQRELGMFKLGQLVELLPVENTVKEVILRLEYKGETLEQRVRYQAQDYSVGIYEPHGYQIQGHRLVQVQTNNPPVGLHLKATGEKHQYRLVKVFAPQRAEVDKLCGLPGMSFQRGDQAEELLQRLQREIQAQRKRDPSYRCSYQQLHSDDGGRPLQHLIFPGQRVILAFEKGRLSSMGIYQHPEETSP